MRITVDEVKQVCNLKNLKDTDILLSVFPLIEAKLSEITNRTTYNRWVKETAEPDIITSFKLAFAYFVYAECLDFLNTTTTGAGIIRSTGFADSRTELIGIDETIKRQRNLELKAYTVLFKYLNAKGLKRYNELQLWDDLQRAETEQARNEILAKGKRCLIALI